MTRILHILIAFDQFVFCLITLGGAYPNETMSSAAYRGELDGKLTGKIFRPLIDALFWFNPNHCQQAYFNVVNNKQLPSSYSE
jgi:hypothetical protein